MNLRPIESFQIDSCVPTKLTTGCSNWPCPWNLKFAKNWRTSHHRVVESSQIDSCEHQSPGSTGTTWLSCLLYLLANLFVSSQSSWLDQQATQLEIRESKDHRVISNRFLCTHEIDNGLLQLALSMKFEVSTRWRNFTPSCRWVISNRFLWAPVSRVYRDHLAILFTISVSELIRVKPIELTGSASHAAGDSWI